MATKPDTQMTYKEALDYAIFAINTFTAPDASSSEDCARLDERADEVIATLADMRDTVQGGAA